MRSTKKSLIMSTISLILCFAMLLGSTYAWFTDEVTSGVNKIVAGNLDVELYHSTTATVSAVDENKVGANTKLFNNITKWEPGMVAYENFTVKNVGNLALKYQLAMTVGDFNTVDGHSLKEVLKVAVVPGGFTGGRAEAQALTGYTTLENFSTSSNGALLPAAGDTFGVVIYWQPTDNDNDYNLNNGKTATTTDKFTDSKVLGIELGVKLTAQQLPHEEDSFDKFYDKADNEVVATWSGESEEATISNSESVTMQVIEESKVHAEATVEAGTKVKTAGDDVAKDLTENETIKLTIEPDGTPNGITVDIGESVTTYDVSLIKVVTTTEESGGESKTTTEIVEADKPVLVSLDIGVVDLQRFYHHGTELTKVESKDAITGEGMYWYDQTNGNVYFKTKSFSPFASVYPFAGGLGTEAYPYLVANAEHWYRLCALNPVSGYTEYYALEDPENCMASTTGYFKLIDDIDLDGCELPSSCYAHDIHIDGNNKKLANLESVSLFQGGADWVYGPGVGTVEGIDIHDITVADSSFNYGIAATIGGKKNVSIKNVSYNNCAFSDGIAYILEIEGDCVIDNFNVTNCTASTCCVIDAVYSGNFTLKNSSFKDTDVTEGALIASYGAYEYPYLYNGAINYHVGDYVVENVTATGCSSNGGAFVHHITYSGSGDVLFTGCTVKNTLVQSISDTMTTGGFVGHTANYNGTLTLDNCSFQGTVISECSAAGLVGVNQSNIKIKDCTVEEGTIIRTIAADKPAYAFANLSAEKITGNNTFEGHFETSNSSKVNMNGFGSVVTSGSGANWSEYVGIKDSDFTFNTETGEVKYVGEQDLLHVNVTQGITAGYWNQKDINRGKPGGWATGVPYALQTIDKTNVEKNDVIGTLTPITNYANVISDGYKPGQVTPAHFTTTDKSALTSYDAHANTHTYLKDSVAYIDATPDMHGNFWAWNGTISSAAQPSTVTVRVTISSLDANGFVVGSLSKTYTFTPTGLS